MASHNRQRSALMILYEVFNLNPRSHNTSLHFVQSKLDLDLKHMQALMDGDLVTFNGISECTAAAYALHKCMNAEIHPC